MEPARRYRVPERAAADVRGVGDNAGNTVAWTRCSRNIYLQSPCELRAVRGRRDGEGE